MYAAQNGAQNGAQTSVQSSVQSIERNKAAARRWFDDILTRGRLDVADEIFAADHVIHDPHAPAGGWPDGPAGPKMVATVFGGGFGDLQISVEDMVAEGNTVALRWQAHATHSGSLMGIPATGKPVTVTGVNVTRFASDQSDQRGKIVESWYNFDMLTLLQQIGAIPARA